MYRSSHTDTDSGGRRVVPMRRMTISLFAAASLVLAGCAGEGSEGSSPEEANDESSSITSAFKQVPEEKVPEQVAATVIEDAEAEAAEDDSPFIYYDSTSTEQISQVFDAFKADFPFLPELKHASLLARDLAPRIDQESRSGGRTADVALLASDGAANLENRDRLEHVDWKQAGIPDELALTPYSVAATAGLWVFISNKDVMAPPATWDDWMNTPKGRAALWNQSPPFSALVPVWGLEKTTDYVRELVETIDPAMSDAPYAIPQNVAATESVLTINAYHTVAPVLAAGAPLEVVVPDPAPISPLYAAIPKTAKHPKIGTLFIAWLSTKRGSEVYEEATGRGNPLLPTTEYAKLVEGHTVSMWSPTEAARESAAIVELTKVLQGGAGAG